jgi:hypothetical protein
MLHRKNYRAPQHGSLRAGVKNHARNFMIQGDWTALTAYAAAELALSPLGTKGTRETPKRSPAARSCQARASRTQFRRSHPLVAAAIFIAACAWLR